MQNLEKMVESLRNASQAYYNGTPTMSDADYDTLEAAVRALDPGNPVFAEVGAPVSSGWPKCLHAIPMGSLEKAQTLGEFVSWGKGKTGAFFLSEKLDGISVVLTYTGRNLVRAVTRGNGIEGEEITRNVRIMQGVPSTLPLTATSDTVHIRGEIVCLKEDFRNHFQGESNPRNTASGTARRQSNWQKCKHLTVIAYNINARRQSTSREEEFSVLKHWGFQTPFGALCSAIKVSNIYKNYIGYQRETVPYDIDGLVIEVNSTEEREDLGMSSNGLNPKGAIALKFPHDMKKTILRNIVWQTGSSGRVTPVAIFDEVNLAGANVTQASLHNVARFNHFRLYPGCEILVSRRNDVIPFVEANVSLGINL